MDSYDLDMDTSLSEETTVLVESYTLSTHTLDRPTQCMSLAFSFPGWSVLRHLNVCSSLNL
ncbi:hypothetical protein JB92DRAFT_2963228 [Gautieria morchelliformis]|nr:hypothetical protein JB92DRAFT_1152938 [Gautieria morchelliformis]KAF8506272.1 hypothetical protein JB92DRAFT_2963228 [Gautieria morchelliformis]